MRDIYTIYREVSGQDILLESKANDIYDKYIKNSEFLKSLKQIAGSLIKKAGKTALINCLNVYYVCIESNIPLQEKMSAFACLLHVISPIDIIPDYLPGGFSDDIALLAYTINFLKRYITDDIKKKSEDKYNEWFK